LDKKLELPLIKNTSELNAYLNEAYWWMKYIMVCNSLNQQFKLGHKSFFSGHEIDEKFKNNVFDFTTYKTLADKHISAISDSLIKQAKYYTSIAEWLNTNQSDTLYDSIKIKILLLINSDYYGKSFMGKAIDSLAYSNPNIFYRLTNEFKFKSHFYSSISKKSNIKLLNSSCNKADIKEYKKYKRNELIAPIAYLSIIVLEIAGVSFGIYKLIKH
jgi:hypothetical protein